MRAHFGEDSIYVGYTTSAIGQTIKFCMVTIDQTSEENFFGVQHTPTVRTKNFGDPTFRVDHRPATKAS